MTEFARASDQQTNLSPEQQLAYSELFREAGSAVLRAIEASDYVYGIDKFCETFVSGMLSGKSVWSIGEFKRYKTTAHNMASVDTVSVYLVDNGIVTAIPESHKTGDPYRPGSFGESESVVTELYNDLIGMVDDEQFRAEHALPQQ